MKKRGKKIIEIASAGSIIKVSKAMTAAGNPNPKNPFTIPAIKKVIIMNKTTEISEDGDK